MQRHTLDNVDFYEEDGRYYARLKYIIEDDFEIRELIIPKVSVGINKRDFPEIDCIHKFAWEPFVKDVRMALGETQFRIYPREGHDGKERVYCTEKVLKKKTKKMTVAEIEKKLGYKIEIISEE